MSTGDQSEYLRKKMAERRATYEQGGQFMKSGFSRWAENERPARQGGAKKEPAERESTGAGKDILARVRRMTQDMYGKYYEGSARHIKGKHEESESESDEEDMEGGLMPMGVDEASEIRQGRGYSGNGYSGNGRLEEHAHDLLAMAKKHKGKGRLDCVHHEEGEGTHIKKGKAKVPMAKEHGVKPSMKTYEKETLGKGRRKGKGFKEGVDESVKTAAAIGDVAKHGYDVYNKATSDPFGALDSAKGILQSGLTAKSHATKAAEEFKAMGSGRPLRKTKAEEEEATGRVESMGSGKKSARAALVKKIMKEKGLSLPAASKYVKEHGLYKA